MVEILRISCLKGTSDYAKKRIDHANMSMARWLSIYTIVTELLMYNVNFGHSGTRDAYIYNISFAVLAVVTIQLFIISMLYKKGNVKHKIVVSSLTIFVLSCSVCGTLIGRQNYEIIPQIVIFLPFVMWNFALLYLSPIIMVILSFLTFVILPDVFLADVVIGDTIHYILMLFSIMMIAINLNRFINKYKTSLQEEQMIELNDSLFQISTYDDLTKVKNRYALRVDYEKYTGKKLIVAMIDIDDFKFFNDRYGHSYGDRILKDTSKTISSMFDKRSIYRYGGDEFLVILEDYDVKKFHNLMVAWQKKVAEENLEEVVKPECTVGYIYGTSSDQDDLRQMIALADTKLFVGKEKGKHTVQGAFYDSKQQAEEVQRPMKKGYRAGEYDVLTGLPNMSYFRNKASMYQQIILKNGDIPVVVFLNIKGLKNYNAAYGFLAGDRLIKQSANILLRNFPRDLVCRFGDDHFAVLTKKQNIEETLDAIEEHIIEIRLDDHTIIQGGIYEYTSNSMDIMEACDNAKMACDCLKENYAVYYTFYDEKLAAKKKERQYILDNFKQAMDRDWIEVYYQPITRSVTGEICNAEALSRWNDPVFGMLNPGEYIGVLEKASLIDQHDRYILKKVCRDLKRMRKDGNNAVPVSVNLSRVNFESDDCVKQLVDIVDHAKLPHDMICFELTESALIEDEGDLLNKVKELQSYGFRIWMDDFGSGYSSLNHLAEYSFDLVKADMRFVYNIDTNENNKIILHHIVSMSKELGIQILAEGVETKEQVDLLKGIGCEKLQGYYYSKPLRFGKFIHDSEAHLMPPSELHEKKDYYQAISQVNLHKPSLIDIDARIDRLDDGIPAAVFEVHEGNIHALLLNDAYYNHAAWFELDTKEEIDIFINQTSTYIKPLLIKQMENAKESGKWTHFEFLHNGDICNAMVHHIKHCDYNGADSYCLLVVNVTRYVQITSKGRIGATLGSLFKTFARVDVFSDTGMYKECIYKDPSCKSSTIAIDIMGYDQNAFVQNYIIASQQEEFLQFIDPTTLLKRIDHAGNGYIKKEFMTKLLDECLKIEYVIVAIDFEDEVKFIVLVKEIENC